MTGIICTIPKFQFNGPDGLALSGGTLTTYLAGTTTLEATYQDQSLTIANTNPIVLDAAGGCTIWLDDAKRYKFILKSSAGVTQWTQDNINGATSIDQIAASSGASMVGYMPAGTGAVATTVQDKLRESVSAKDFGASTANTASANATAINAAFSALASGGTVLIPAGTFLSTALTVPNSNIKLQLDAAAVLSFPTLGASTSAITVNANNFSIEGGKIQGPASGVYVADESAIKMYGTSSASRKSGLVVRNCEITAFGSYGINAKWVDNIDIQSNNFHDIGYSGAAFQSCSHGVFLGNRVYNITPGTASNMYGITLTHDSTSYNLDPNAGTKSALNPFCWDWYVAGNHVEAIAWEGIDCHGGYEITIDGNKVYATKNGIACQASSGAANNYAGWNNKVINNVVDAATSAGVASGYENQSYGICVNGGSTVLHDRVLVSGNTIINKGILSNASSGAIQALYCSNAIIESNVTKKWYGSGVIASNSYNVVISKNQFLELAGVVGTAEFGIIATGIVANGKTFTITQNQVAANGGVAARIGVRFSDITTAPFFEGNDFSPATSAAYFMVAPFQGWTDNDALFVYTVNNAGTGETIDVSPMYRYKEFTILLASSNALSTVTNLVNGPLYQTVKIQGDSATASTYTRANSLLPGGVNFTINRYYILTLKKMNAAGGAQWVGVSTANNS